MNEQTASPSGRRSASCACVSDPFVQAPDTTALAELAPHRRPCAQAQPRSDRRVYLVFIAGTQAGAAAAGLGDRHPPQERQISQEAAEQRVADSPGIALGALLDDPCVA